MRLDGSLRVCIFKCIPLLATTPVSQVGPEFTTTTCTAKSKHYDLLLILI